VRCGVDVQMTQMVFCTSEVVDQGSTRLKGVTLVDSSGCSSQTREGRLVVIVSSS